ncbi:PilW family protein [Massilia sp. R2A-15]|uniref:PilW family protein n=1 Tax=Massilia sp. R2A-15 TaxID=3064278 RepID=UPI0027374363|nr:PilW family protein [Massilia sp. R2A-15]WLI91492.1 PilW family protein [Massilia sp. R2A-15]
MKTFRSPAPARGFSLVELMISIVIGLLALVFATRLVANAEVNKQAAVGSSDSMQNGMLGLFSIEKDLSQAGWGLNDPLINGCDTVFSDANGYALLGVTRNSVAVTPLTAAVIQSNGANPDVIAIYSGSAMSNTGMLRVASNYAASSGSIDVDRNPYGFTGTDEVAAGGDVILVAPELPGASKCALAQVSHADAPAAQGGQNKIVVASGGNNRFNSGSLGVAFNSLQARLFNLGPASQLSLHTWSLSRGFLQLRATNLAGASRAPATVIDNVVSLKAQYGLDKRASFLPEQGMTVTQWSNTVGDADGDGVENQADYQRVAAIRVAVVARSRTPEKPNGSGVCTATPALPTVFGSISVNVAVTGDTVDWKCYRYRSFETIVPIRNSAWRPTP